MAYPQHQLEWNGIYILH